jgi:hypothetical protein
MVRIIGIGVVLTVSPVPLYAAIFPATFAALSQRTFGRKFAKTQKIVSCFHKKRSGNIRLYARFKFFAAFRERLRILRQRSAKPAPPP